MLPILEKPNNSRYKSWTERRSKAGRGYLFQVSQNVISMEGTTSLTAVKLLFIFVLLQGRRFSKNRLRIYGITKSCIFTTVYRTMNLFWILQFCVFQKSLTKNMKMLKRNSITFQVNYINIIWTITIWLLIDGVNDYTICN